MLVHAGPWPSNLPLFPKGSLGSRALTSWALIALCLLPGPWGPKETREAKPTKQEKTLQTQAVLSSSIMWWKYSEALRDPLYQGGVIIHLEVVTRGMRYSTHFLLVIILQFRNFKTAIRERNNVYWPATYLQAQTAMHGVKTIWKKNKIKERQAENCSAQRSAGMLLFSEMRAACSHFFFLTICLWVKA